MKRRLFLKRLSLINIIIVIIVYIQALIAERALGYELSIYTRYSPFFWVLLFTTLIIAIAIIFLCEYWAINNYWEIAFFSIVFIYCIFLLLPLFSGYYILARSDIFSHLYWTQHILNTGTINTFYPIVHILYAYFYYFEIDLETSTYFIPIVFTILNILFLCILGFLIQEKPRSSLLPVLFSLPLLFGVFHFNTYPFIFGLFFIPLVFFLIIKSSNTPNDHGYSVLLIPLVFFIVFLHPLIAVLLIILLMGFFFSNVLVNKIDPVSKKYNRPILNTILLLIISFTFWYISFNSIIQFFKAVIDTFFETSDEVTTILNQHTEIIASSGADFYYFSRLLIFNYGSIILYLLLGIICLFVLIIRMRNISINEVNFSFQYLFGLIISFSFITGYFIISEPVRALSPAILMSMIFIPLVLSHVILKISVPSLKKYIFILLFFFIIIPIFFTIFSIFPSPIISVNSWHHTHMEKEGIDWFLTESIDEIPVLLMQNTSYYNKYINYFYSKYPEKFHNNIRKIEFHRTVPKHFGYLLNTSFAKTMNNDEYYYISTEFHRQIHLAVPENRREILHNTLTHEDFKRLKQDESINLLYNNGEFESWWIPKI